MGNAKVLCENLVKEYGTGEGTTRALGPIDIAVENCSFVSVLGPSGCGKSTLLLLVAGLLPSTSGSVTVDGKVVDKPLTDVGIAFQDSLLLDFRTAEANVLLQASIRGMPMEPARQRTAQLLQQLGVDKARDKYPKQLSGGMKQRVSLARALVHSPSLLLLDEPFGALDAMTRTQAQRDVEVLWMTTSVTVLLITHSIEEAVRLGDRVLVMGRSPGQIVEDLPIDLPRPRGSLTFHDERLRGYVDHLYELFDRLGVLSAAEPSLSDRDGALRGRIDDSSIEKEAPLHHG